MFEYEDDIEDIIETAVYDDVPDVVDLPVVLPGERSEVVEIIQHLLSFYRSDTPVDGIFGPDTERAVRNFQSKSACEEQGIVGPETWACLLKVR